MGRLLCHPCLPLLFGVWIRALLGGCFVVHFDGFLCRAGLFVLDVVLWVNLPSFSSSHNYFPCILEDAMRS